MVAESHTGTSQLNGIVINICSRQWSKYCLERLPRVHLDKYLTCGWPAKHLNSFDLITFNLFENPGFFAYPGSRDYRICLKLYLFSLKEVYNLRLICTFQHSNTGGSLTFWVSVSDAQTARPHSHWIQRPGRWHYNSNPGISLVVRKLQYCSATVLLRSLNLTLTWLRDRGSSSSRSGYCAYS